MFDHRCGPRDREWAGRGWDWKSDPSNFGSFFFGGGHRRGGPWRAGRMFEQGGLKFVILRLLDEKPRHGYDIIKELEERSGGRYTPSPGTVYPTLTMLEEMGFASSSTEDGGKKVYSITDAGRQHLAENKGAVDEVIDRLAQVGASIFGEQMRAAHEAMGALGRTYVHATMHRTADPAYVSRVVEILRKAAADIEELMTAK
ncbi:MAG TPA: PadR family transcriptional regulator [Gemmatimonadaceae bacterium]|nr:PadR family transcriptional regulator [Gemmatimonadaceae bacterium]